MWKFGPILALFFLWTITIRRVDADAEYLSLRKSRWNTLLLFCFLFGLLTAILMPSYLAGLGVAIFAYTVPVWVYVVHRNRQVGPLDRVMTWSDFGRRFRGETRFRRQPDQRPDSGESKTESEADRVVFVGKSQSKLNEDVQLTEYARTSENYRTAVDLIATAVEQLATDLHINPKENEAVVRIRLDGKLKSLEPLKKSVGVGVINIFKVLADMDISVKKGAQDGSFRADIDGRRLNFRVATQSTQVGEKMSIRILDPGLSLTRFQDLGISPSMCESLRACLGRTNGLLLICGPTGAGKSTTAYAALRETDLDDLNVMSVEDPIESNIPQIDQIEVNARTGQTFETALLSLLRQDPDIILIGEIRDQASATIACQAATTGMLVVSTIHGLTPMGALLRMIELGVEPYSVAAAVNATLGQRLARRLCDDCKEPYSPDEQILERIGLPNVDSLTLHRAPPADDNDCPTCNGRGVFRKIGIFEFLEMSKSLRKMVRGKADESQFNLAATEHGMSTMQSSALSLLTRGIISVEEYFHVLNE